MPGRDTLGPLLRGTATCLLLASVAIMIGIGLLPRTGWYRTLTVLSGSMQPTFSPGDFVVAAPKTSDEVQVGDVLVYQIPVGDHHVESHRIVQILGRRPSLVVRTKGDANRVMDPWTAVLDGNRFWTVRGTVPYAGRAILWLRAPRTHEIVTYFLPALVAILFLHLIWRRSEEDDAPADVNVYRRA